MLLPVLDDEKHYYVGDDEVEKLLRHGEGWLGKHPERHLIVSRYLKRRSSLMDQAFARLFDEESPEVEAAESRSEEAEWLNNTVNIDTGAVFGGKLTAMRYPEREFISVPAIREYSVPSRPIIAPDPEARTSQQVLDDVLDLEDVTGKRIVETRLHRTITIREENSEPSLRFHGRYLVTGSSGDQLARNPFIEQHSQSCN